MHPPFCKSVAHRVDTESFCVVLCVRGEFYKYLVALISCSTCTAWCARAILEFSSLFLLLLIPEAMVGCASGIRKYFYENVETSVPLKLRERNSPLETIKIYICSCLRVETFANANK